MPKVKLAVWISTLAISGTGTAHAGSLWIGNLNQAQENPPTGVPFTGTGFLILNDAETSATVTVTHNVPAAIITDGHIHRAPVGTNGPVIFPFPRVGGPAGISPVGPLTWAIPAAEVPNLKAQLLYFNIHTQANPAGAIRGQISRALLAGSAADASQLAVANALDVSAGFNADLDQLLMNAALASPSARSQLLGELSGATIYAQGRQAVETMADAEESLFAHAEDVAGEPVTGLRLFANARETFGKRDSEVGQAGAKVSRTAVMGGFNFGSAGAFNGGLAIGYATGEDRFRGGGGETDAKTTSLHAFTAFGGADGPLITVVGGYGWTKFDADRNLGAIGRTSTTSHDGKVWSLGAKVSVPVVLGDGLKLSPYGLIDMQRATIDAYRETTGASAGLVVPKHKQKTSAAELGAAVMLPFRGDGGGLRARLQAGWRYLLDEGDHTIATGLAGTPVLFQTRVLSPGRSAAHLNASLVGKLAPNLTASASYRGLVSGRTDMHSVQLRIALTM